jgi:hypothetical protein
MTAALSRGHKAVNPESLEKISHHHSEIDKFDVTGFEYRTPAGGTCWNLTMVDLELNLRRYWLADGEYHAVTTHILAPRNGGGMTFQIREVVEPPANVKQLLSKAIRDWESVQSTG